MLQSIDPSNSIGANKSFNSFCGTLQPHPLSLLKEVRLKFAGRLCSFAENRGSAILAIMIAKSVFRRCVYIGICLLCLDNKKKNDNLSLKRQINALFLPFRL
ncbi:hypothetical protein MHBO_001700 [Bonamia ostreae]|uniref:Uncharacterized protein n=1 Tax=Bonamia ostreae TaxID=126728 RepID=A0ABV2AKN6_9EUKA